ncbi:GNAT family N-acetyltransferase [Pseudoxanthomonas yeongjuensis]|uniref:GNAT family N-acetyltransferase n=1 Tax=Pseudoxanthomonas yeongjuensis TaxID=377616 RepID=UPI001391A5C0|nr:GNAT family N-acetyltransferase [Pseudoxanthomonas yeongjuensis]KAF1718084.1 GNAT family N-acetyltransferase [Pseudoxanthomonas yeongjuensis]
MPTNHAFELRSARLADAAEVARLSTQLGYPANEREMAGRLDAVLSAADRHVFVAARGQRLWGWIGIELRTTLETGLKAEIVGLVVDDEARRSGVGRALVDAAEAWVREQGLHTLMVRSNTARVESHPFYQGLGFVRRKSQHVYFKALD